MREGGIFEFMCDDTVGSSPPGKRQVQAKAQKYGREQGWSQGLGKVACGERR